MSAERPQPNIDGSRVKDGLTTTPKQDIKIGLFNKGIKVSMAARAAIEGEEGRALSTSDYASTSGMALYMGDGIYVNAPIVDNNPNFVREDDTPYSLERDENSGLIVLGGEEPVPVEYIPVPSYLDKTNDRGVPYRLLAITHLDRVRISPVEGCAIACQFCNLPYEYKYSKHAVNDLVDSVRVAVEDPVVPAQHVLISGGTPKPEDYGYLNDVYENVAGTFPGLAVDIMMAPAGNLLEPRQLKDFGIHGLSINLELWNRDIAKSKARGKYNIGRDEYLQFLDKAVDVFGPGKIRSLLMVGIEPLDDTLRGVEELAKRGVDPVLSPFRPDPATPLRDEQPPSVELQTQAYLKAREIVDRYDGVVLGPRCIPDQHNTLSFPYKSDGSFYKHTYNPS